MIGAVIVALLAVAALAYVAGPLRRDDEAPRPPIDPRLEAEGRKDSALQAILELEDERLVGKLTQADLDSLRARYELEALHALRDLDLLAGTVDDPIEAEIAELRRRLSCTNCGALRDPGVSCPRCGAA